MIVLVAVAGVGTVVAALVLTGDDEPAKGTDLLPSPVHDESGSIGVTVPAAWDDVNRDPFVRSNGEELPRIEAAPDLDDYRQREGPGLELVYSAKLGNEHLGALLDEVAQRTDAKARCETSERRTFERRGYQGLSEIHRGCGSAGRTLEVVAAVLPGGEGVVVVAVQSGSEDERDAVLDSFSVLG